MNQRLDENEAEFPRLYRRGPIEAKLAQA